MKFKKTALVFILLCSITGGVFSQEKQVQNLANYYNRWLHFGFLLGINNADFILRPEPDFYKFDSLKSVNTTSHIGFHLGIVSELKLAEYLCVRFVPDLAFSQRDIEFLYVGNKDSILRTKKVESTFLNFPLHFKLRSARLNNFGVYLLGGARYSIDLASQKDVNNNLSSATLADIKLEKSDLSVDVGAGIDFYFPYFKFAVEGRMSYGLKNLLIKDDPLFSASIESLYSKIFTVSITFEG